MFDSELHRTQNVRLLAEAVHAIRSCGALAGGTAADRRSPEGGGTIIWNNIYPYSGAPTNTPSAVSFTILGFSLIAPPNTQGGEGEVALDGEIPNPDLLGTAKPVVIQRQRRTVFRRIWLRGGLS